MMKKIIENYFLQLFQSLKNIETTNQAGRALTIERGMEEAIRLILKTARAGGKLIFIGNGASASMASHQAVDFWKASGIPAMAFNDAALLTCISNDFGYEKVFEKPLEVFLKRTDLLVAISSSGESRNVLGAVRLAQKKKAAILTLSGFSRGNKLRRLGHYNFYVPARTYGLVEVTHHAILHGLLDTLISSR